MTAVMRRTQIAGGDNTIPPRQWSRRCCASPRQTTRPSTSAFRRGRAIWWATVPCARSASGATARISYAHRRQRRRRPRPRPPRRPHRHRPPHRPSYRPVRHRRRLQSRLSHRQHGHRRDCRRRRRHPRCRRRSRRLAAEYTPPSLSSPTPQRPSQTVTPPRAARRCFSPASSQRAREAAGCWRCSGFGARCVGDAVVGRA